MEQTSSSPPSTVDYQEVLDNIDGHLHGPMPKFIQKFFCDILNIRDDDDSGKENNTASVNSDDCHPTRWPSGHSFTSWFCHTTTDRQMSWDHAEVIGQFCTSNIGYREGLLRLCHSAHKVFATQPTRLFVQGFYIRRFTLELWVFDRSGLYCSEPMDLRKGLSQLEAIILGYQCMETSQFGHLGILKTDEHGSHITLAESARTESFIRLLDIDTAPITSRGLIVGSGTTCYRAKASGSTSWTHAVKFKWRWIRDRPEDELLKKAKRHGITGTIAVDHYEELETTANLRAGLRWGKHRRFLGLPDTLGNPLEEGLSVDGGLIKYTEATDDFFQNRVLACIVTSPLGRPLHTFRSLKELLQVFPDVLKTHKALLQEAKILHQDISAGNILIVDDQDTGKSRGVLIDLDTAIELDDGGESEPGITGTRPFMAIGVLKIQTHTYRHDLESFFYVFLWIIITNHKESPPPTSRLKRWSVGDWDELAKRKLADMSQEGLESLLGEFDPMYECLKPLAREVHQLLFPRHEGCLYIATDVAREAEDALYGGMMSAFQAFTDKLAEQ